VSVTADAQVLVGAGAGAGVATTFDRASARKVILASSVGTIFEYYDFYLYGTLAVFFGTMFFPPGNEQAALLASLATFGASAI
jgi:hypothetical protein